MKVRVPFSPSKSLAAELEASTAVVIRSANVGVDVPSSSRRIMFMSHATDVKARAAECTVSELVAASLRSTWRVIIPRRLSNVSHHRETSGTFYTYLMVTHTGRVVRVLLC